VFIKVCLSVFAYVNVGSVTCSVCILLCVGRYQSGWCCIYQPLSLIFCSVGKFLVTGATIGPLLPSWMPLLQWRWNWFNWYSIWERK